jgi:P-type Cu+ transporter
MIDLPAWVPVLIDNGESRTSDRVLYPPPAAQRVDKGGLAGSHIAMKSENFSGRELPPEVAGGRLDFRQLKAELHAIKIGTFAVYMETVNWKVEGMSCSTCALTISKFLEKKGGQNVRVSLAGGDVSFDLKDNLDRLQLREGINKLGYTVVGGQEGAGTGGKGAISGRRRFNKHLGYFLFCLPFTILLTLPMAPGLSSLHFLMQPWVQLAVCLPVYIAGALFFGRSAVQSLLNGSPNMNVLIALGASAAFGYSVAGTLFHLGPDYQFYETAASIITIVFFGYYIEDASIQATQRSLKKLAVSQKTMANMIAFDDQHHEILFPVESTRLRSGDLILIRSGEPVPADCKILWGEAGVDESILTGESLAVDKAAKDTLIGGSLLVSGIVKAQVTASAGESVLAGIVRLVQRAQGEKPPLQQLADRISAVFVPVVLLLATVTFLGNYFYLHATAPALMRSVAVLVIACPCAMGLATPAAIAVGLGRAARKGILIRNARHLEAFRHIRQVIFDKTGTLTTGEFSIHEWRSFSRTPEEFRQIAFSLEKYSSHPIARSITREWKGRSSLRWVRVEEVRGLGMRGETPEGDIYWAGSYKVAAALTADATHNVYVVCNDELLGWIDIRDTVRPESASVVRWLQQNGIHTVLLSGDRKDTCLALARELGVSEVLAEQTPEQKLRQVALLNARMPAAMVGDGINDAPALAGATIGISMSDSSHLAMETADVVLMDHGLRRLPAALELGRYTFSTIRGNLFWAFAYNVIAIPVAAFGGLVPAVAALAMGFSDVVLAANSLRLYTKKIAEPDHADR